MRKDPLYSPTTRERKFVYNDRYRSIVVDNVDKEKFGRVKVFIPDLMMEPKKPTASSKKNEEKLIRVNNEDVAGIWAWPGNNALGGRNVDKNFDTHHYGDCHIPHVGDWMWIKFENGNPNRPIYLGAINIEHKKVPPENQLGDEYWNKWTVLRSPMGRVTVISDDPDDERVEITGKKRDYIEGNQNRQEDATSSVYTIDGNQTTILIDERKDKLKILIKDYKGNYINIKQTDDSFNIFGHGELKVHFEDDVHITFDKDVFAHIKGNVHTTIDGNENKEVLGTVGNIVEGNQREHIGGNCDQIIFGETNILGSAEYAVDAPTIHLNSGHANPQSPSSPDGPPELPNGDRE